MKCKPGEVGLEEDYDGSIGAALKPESSGVATAMDNLKI
jgi:hypothetical protein